jgi:hypothetical protein
MWDSTALSAPLFGLVSTFCKIGQVGLVLYQGTTLEAAEKLSVEEKPLPQRLLKPHSLQSSYGRPEGRPLQRIRVFPQPL